MAVYACCIPVSFTSSLHSHYKVESDDVIVQEDNLLLEEGWGFEIAQNPSPHAIVWIM